MSSLRQDAPVSDPEPVLVDTVAGKLAITREGPTSTHQLVCLHGVPGSHWDYRYLAPQLRARHEVIRIDMPGFASSPYASDALTLDAWVRILGAVIEALGISACSLVAHSLGTAPAVAAACRWPDTIRHLVLLAPVGHRRHRAYALPPELWRGVKHLLTVPGVRNVIAKALEAIYVALGNKLRHSGWRPLHVAISLASSMDFAAHAALAARLPCPTLVAHSRDDRAVQFEIGQALARTIPHCETLFFDDAGHQLQKTRAADIAARILAGVASLD